MKYQYWLSNIPGVGCKTIHRLLGQAGSAEEIYFLKKEQLEKLAGLSDRQVLAITERKMDWDLEEKYAKLGENGTTFLSYEMDSYPEQLRQHRRCTLQFVCERKTARFFQKACGNRRGKNVF